jgi:hypothetical protein
MTITFVRAALGPLLAVGLAAALWEISGRLLYVGPFDRATFGWLVVIPLWAVAPAAVGLAGRDLADIPRTPAALIDGIAVAAIAGGLLWWSAVTVDCLPTHTPIELAFPAVAMGLIAGGAFAVACQIAGSEVVGGHPWRAVASGSIPQLITLAIVPVAYFFAFFGLCQRP